MGRISPIFVRDATWQHLCAIGAAVYAGARCRYRSDAMRILTSGVFPMSDNSTPPEEEVLSRALRCHLNSYAWRMYHWVAKTPAGEMILPVAPGRARATGFATTAHAFRCFLEHGVADRIHRCLATLDTDDRSLVNVGAQVRGWCWPSHFRLTRGYVAVRQAYAQLGAGSPQATYAVRPSATAEDLPDAFAGATGDVLEWVVSMQCCTKIKVFTSLVANDRAISYHAHKGFAHAEVALSAGLQRMVRSKTLGSAGGVSTIDTESGFEDVVFITANYGLGETVQGAVNPTSTMCTSLCCVLASVLIRDAVWALLIQMVFASEHESAQTGTIGKTINVPSEQRNRYALTQQDVLTLARYALAIEQHYGRPNGY